MADLKLGGATPKTIIMGQNYKTGMPAAVKNIYYGSKWIWTAYAGDIVQSYVNSGVWNYPLPDYEAEVDIVVVGGGGGGRVGNGANNTAGSGGLVGDVKIGTLTGIKGGNMVVTVGAGGSGGNPGAGNGGESKVAIGWQSVAASGGTGGGNSSQNARTYTTFDNYFGHSHLVLQHGLGSSGRGGNGGFFGSYTDGQAGNNGYVWLRIRKVYP